MTENICGNDSENVIVIILSSLKNKCKIIWLQVYKLHIFAEVI